MPQQSLKEKTTNGLFWSSVDRFSSQGISFVFSILIARLLSPHDYGIVAMVSVFFAVAQSFVDSGFSNALIRKKDRTDADLSTCFYFNIFVGIVFYALLFFLAPYIAIFYDQPILDSIVKVSGLNVIFNSLSVVQNAQFSYQLEFKTIAKVTLSSTIFSSIAGLFFAYKGYGVWALVIQGVSATFIRTLVLWILSKWHPRSRFSRESFNYLFGYGSKILASGLLDTIYNNIYPMVIGKFYTPTQLGNYSRAFGWAQLPSANISSVIQRVTFPVLSEIQDDSLRLEKNYRKLLRLSSFVIFPLMVGMAALATPIVRVCLTSKWDGCILYLQVICFALMWYPIHAINLNLLQVKGRSDLFLKLEFIKKGIGLAILLVTLPISILFVCIGCVLESLLDLFINTYYTGKLIQVGYFKQMKDLLPILMVSLGMGIVVYISSLFFTNEFIKLIIGIPLGFFVYLIGTYLFAHEELSELVKVIKKK